MPDDLLAFVNARLDEDERLAQAADDAIGLRYGERRGWFLDVDGPDDWPGAGYINNDYVCVGVEIAPYVFAQDPRDTLDRVAALRAVVAMHDDPHKCAAAHWPPCPCPTLRALASAWRSHPDWRTEWAPDGVEVAR